MALSRTGALEMGRLFEKGFFLEEGAQSNHYAVWRAVCFKIIFVSCTISLSFSLNFPSLFGIICCFFFISLLVTFGIHRDTVVLTYSLSVVRITLSVVPIRTTNCRL